MSDPTSLEPELKSPPFELNPVEEPEADTGSPGVVEVSLEPEPGTAQTDTSTTSSLPPNVKQLKSEFESISLERSASDQTSPNEGLPTAEASSSRSPTSTPQQDEAQSSLESIAISQQQTPAASATTQASSTDGHQSGADGEGERAKDATAQVEAATEVDAPKPTPQRKLSTSAPTTMQKVMSLTRQRDLPPKSKDEEVSSRCYCSCVRTRARTATANN